MRTHWGKVSIVRPYFNSVILVEVLANTDGRMRMLHASTYHECLYCACLNDALACAHSARASSYQLLQQLEREANKDRRAGRCGSETIAVLGSGLHAHANLHLTATYTATGDAYRTTICAMRTPHYCTTQIECTWQRTARLAKPQCVCEKLHC